VTLFGSLDQDPTDRIKRRGRSSPRVRVASSPARSVARGWTPVSFWRLLGDGDATTVCRRTRRTCGMVDFVDRFRLRRGGVAGDAGASVSSSLAMNRSIPCEIGQTVNTSRRVRSREEERGREEGSGHHGWVGIGDARRRRLQVPDEKFVGLERFFAREKKRGRGRRARGFYRRRLSCEGG
jgi:hypothetical protein